jgi:Na+(H+)/acetate symporter ActP
MFENLRNQINLAALLIILSSILVFGAAGLWFVRKTTGRPIREMLALLVGALVLISLMGISFAFLHGWMESPDSNARRNADFLMRWGMLPVAFVVWWIFNRLSKPKRQMRRGKTPANHEPIA